MARPATAFTGDFYFTSEVHGFLWFAIGDFAGHGLSAAIYGQMIQEELDRAIRSCDCADPAEVVAIVDRSIRGEIPFNRFATLVIGRAAPDGSLQLVNAGHCYPLILRAGGTVETISSHGPVIGISPLPAWLNFSLTLESGDTLLLYTDGVIEMQNGDGAEFGRCSLERIAGNAPGGDLLDLIVAELTHFGGGLQEDDVTLLALSFR